MTDTVRQEAATRLAEIEKVTATILPEPGTMIVPLKSAPAPQAEAIRKRMGELDMKNTQSIISFGSAAQSELQVISQEMLAGVKNKDVGPAGNSLAISSRRSAAFRLVNSTCGAAEAGGKNCWAVPRHLPISSRDTKRCRGRSTR